VPALLCNLNGISIRVEVILVVEIHIGESFGGLRFSKHDNILVILEGEALAVFGDGLNILFLLDSTALSAFKLLEILLVLCAISMFLKQLLELINITACDPSRVSQHP